MWKAQFADLRRAEVDTNAEKRQFVIDNGASGFELYKIDSSTATRLYEIDSYTKKQVGRQVKFGDDDEIILGGSDHGKVYVFDVKTGRPVDVLWHNNCSAVQTLTVSIIRW